MIFRRLIGGWLENLFEKAKKAMRKSEINHKSIENTIYVYTQSEKRRI